MKAQQANPPEQFEARNVPAEGQSAPEKAVDLTVKALPRGRPQPDTGQPGGGQGRVDITGIMEAGIRITPDITEGHSGYEESGHSEIVPPDHLVPTAWIRKMLLARGIPFEERHHLEVYTAQQVAQNEHFSGHRVAKVVVVMADGHPVELILPASRRVNLERVRTALNVREVRLATEDEIGKFFPDCEVGAIPALRHWKDVDVLMDRALNVEGDILFQAGTHEDAIRLNFRDWYELVQPQVVTLSDPTVWGTFNK